MAGKKNSVSGLIRKGSQGLNVDSLLRAASLVIEPNSGVEKPLSSKTAQDTKTVSMNSKTTAESIRFGSPSSTRAMTSQGGSEWTNLLKQTASGGVSSALGGGLAGLGGLESLISGIASLFGGSKKAPPPLVRFQLPQSQDQTVYVGSAGNTVYQGSAVESSGRSATSGPIYGNSPVSTGTQSLTAQPLRYQSAEIAQAVKNALLNSSSLNDVIAEI